jgi:TolB-like protein/Tfp pilus assembly protein PilF
MSTSEKSLLLSYADLGRQQVKNLEEPIRAFSVTRGDSDTSVSRRSHQPPSRPAIAVLPFTNLSGDSEQEYFADGLTEDVITSLAYWRWFPVIARNSTFAYKGRAKSAMEIGKELGAAYLVEGSVRRAGQRVRISAQLVETATGHHLWAERFDRDIVDIFQLQDEITQYVVANVEPELHRAEQSRIARKPPESLDAWDLTLRALSLQHRMSRRGHVEARVLLEKALAIDPVSSFAWSHLAVCHYHEAILGWAEDRQAALELSLQAAERAVEIEDRNWLAVALRGMGSLWTKRDFDAALKDEEQAVALNPSAPLARHFLACIFEFSGHPEQAIPHLEVIYRLDPRYQFLSLAVADKAMCRLLQGDYDAALVLAQRAIRMLPANVRARQRLCAALALLGRVPEAKTEMLELLRLQPSLTSSYIHTTYPFKISDERELFLDALRVAGIPE